MAGGGGLTARARNPRGEGGRLREDILDAATRLLAGDADAGPVSLRAVAKEVGIAPQSMYLHFGDRTELISAVIERRFAELLRACELAVAKETGVSAKLRAFCTAYCLWGLQNPGHYRLLFESTATSQAGMSYEGSPGAEVFDRFLAVVKESAGDDAFKKAVLLWIAMHGIVSLRLNKPGFPWPRVNELFDDFLRPLIKRPH